jgi:hypothetical protein
MEGTTVRGMQTPSTQKSKTPDACAAGPNAGESHSPRVTMPARPNDTPHRVHLLSYLGQCMRLATCMTRNHRNIGASPTQTCTGIVNPSQFFDIEQRPDTAECVSTFALSFRAEIEYRTQLPGHTRFFNYDKLLGRVGISGRKGKSFIVHTGDRIPH